MSPSLFSTEVQNIHKDLDALSRKYERETLMTEVCKIVVEPWLESIFIKYVAADASVNPKAVKKSPHPSVLRLVGKETHGEDRVLFPGCENEDATLFNVNGSPFVFVAHLRFEPKIEEIEKFCEKWGLEWRQSPLAWADLGQCFAVEVRKKSPPKPKR